MNTFIKRTMILALALAMSLGAWAQQEVLLTTITATGTDTYSETTPGVVTVTHDNDDIYYEFGWVWWGNPGSVTVEAMDGYTITRCVFRQADKNPVTVSTAPFKVNFIYNVENEKYLCEGTDPDEDMDGVASIEVYGYAADPSPTVTRTSDSNWTFTMPDYNAALNVTYYLQPDLAWTYNSAAMPAEGLTAYRGFELPVIGGIMLQASDTFNNAMQGHFELGQVSTPSSTWESSTDNFLAANMDNFVDNSSLTEEQVLAFPNPDPATNYVYLIYGFDGNAVKYVLFNGTNVTPASNGFTKSNIYYLIAEEGAKIFYTASTVAQGLTLRYGSSNPAVVSFSNPNDMSTFSVNGAGEADIYAVFAGDTTFLADSVAFHVTILNPDTLTLSAIGNGTVSALLGGDAVWNNETWANMSSSSMEHSFTVGDITLSHTGNDRQGFVRSGSSGEPLYFYVAGSDLTFTSNGAPFTRIDMEMVNEYTSGRNPNIQPLDGWTFDGYHATWEGNAQSVTMTSCTTKVDQITFTRGSADIVVLDETAGTYLVIPGATVQAVAEAQDGNYVSAWSNSAAVTNRLSDTIALTVSESQTLTATFAQNPLLTLATDGQWGSGTVELDGMGVGTVYNITFEHETTEEGSRTFTIPASRMPYDTTFSYNANITDAYAYDQIGGSVSKIAQGDNWVTVRISGAFEYGGYYSCEFEGASDDWSISCVAGTGPVYPDGIAATETDNTYRVLPGTQLSVTATPEEGYRLAQWSDQTEPVEGDARLGSSHPYTMPATDATLTATFVQNPVLTLASNDSEWGTVTLDGVTPGATTYNITIEGGNTYTNVSFPYHTTVFLHEDLEEVWVEGQSPLSVEKVGNNADITINDSYDGTVTIFYRYGTEGEAGHKFIRCEAVEGLPIMPEGVTYAGYGDYLVLPGTEVKVIATPDSAHYFVNWDEETALNSNTAVEKTLTMGTDDTELTANFAAKPTLTVVCNGNEKGTMELTEVPQETLLTTINSTSPNNTFTSGSQTFDGKAVVTFSGTVSNDNDNKGWYAKGGNLTVTAAEGYTITRVRFANRLRSLFDTQEPFSANYHSNVGMAAVRFGDENQSMTNVGVYQIEVYGYCNSCPATHLVNVTDSTYRVDYGTQVIATATAKDGYHMDSWSNGAAVTDLLVNNNTVTVTTDSTIRANFIANPLLTLATNGQGGTVSLEGYSPAATTYNITIEGGNTYTNVTFPFQTTVFLHDGLSDVGSGQYPLSAIRDGNSAAITISEPYGGDRSVSYTYIDNEDFISGHKNISCQSVESAPIIPAGVTYAGDNTYRVLPGTQVKVIATPDSAHYFVNWNEETALNSNTAVEKTLTMGTDDATLTANFEHKPTLTLAHNDGGEMEIVPAGGVTAIVPPTDQINLWEDNYGGFLAENDMPATLGFVAVDQAAAEAWTGAPASGEAMLIYDIDEEDFYYLLFRDGSLTGNNDATFSPGGFYAMASDGVLYITTGATPSNVTATAEPNTYYIDYGTSVTVKATPSDTTYLVRFDQDADTNSNVAVEKTYGPLTANVTARATFNDKPVLTLAANDTTWGKVMLEGAASGNSNGETIAQFLASEVNNEVWHEITGTVSNITSTTYGNFDLTDNTASVYVYGLLTPDMQYRQFESMGIVEGTNITIMAHRGEYNSIPQANGAYLVSINPAPLPAGVAQLDSVTYRVDYGTEVTVIADATELHHVANWVNEDSVAYPADSITYSDYFVTDPVALFPAHSTLRLTVTADTTTKALFGINSYDVTATVAESDDVRGTVQIAYTDPQGTAHTTAAGQTASATAQGGSTSTLTATAETGYHFVQWSDADTTNPRTTTSALEVTASFDTNVYSITATNQVDDRASVGSGLEMGSVEIAGRHMHFLTDTLTATAAHGYRFVKWSDGVRSNPRIVATVQDSNFHAEYAVLPYNVSGSSLPSERGSVSGSATVPYLTPVTLTATSNYGYTFTQWSDGVTDNPRTVVATDNISLQAYYEKNMYRLEMTTADASRGTLSSDFAGNARYVNCEYLYAITITATPTQGYRFTQWHDGNTENPRTIVITQDTLVEAFFGIEQYTVSVDVNDTVMGTVAGGGTVDYLDTVDISATANAHYHFVQWNDGNTAASRRVVATDNLTYTAQFAPDVYTFTLETNNSTMGTIAVTAPANATPNADGSYSFDYGTAVTVVATPTGRCFELGSWSNGAEVSADGSLSFTVEGDMQLGATFANHLYTSDTAANVCDRFTWNGIAYTETPDVAPLRRHVTADGCDSAVVLNLTVRHSSTGDTNAIACNSYSWYEHTDMTETQNVSHLFAGANAEGCDSILMLHLTIGNMAMSDTVAVACEEFEWHGVTYTETPAVAPTYTHHTAEGCDSIVTLRLTVAHSVAVDTVAVACDEFEWHGVTYTETPAEAPTYTYQTAAGCDSTVTLRLTIGHNTQSDTVAVACDEFVWHGVTYTETPAEAPTYTYQTAAGCDSTVTLTLTVNQSSTATVTVIAGGSYEWNGQTYTESGNYTYTTTGSNGCDSVTTLQLTINNVVNGTETMVACESYTWNGTVYTASGDYTYSHLDNYGNTQVDTLHLTINNSVEHSFADVACSQYAWDGTVYTESGNYSKSYTAANGCDSTVTLHLTINHSSSAVETAEACGSYTWHGTTYTSSTSTPSYTSLNAAGCDSVTTLNLTVKQPVTSSVIASACDSYLWNGETYTQSGNYTYTGEAANGCDSTVTLQLTLKQSTSGVETITACDSYTWHGTTYTSSTSTPSYTSVNAAGCDSTTTLHLTINQATSSTEAVATCESYTWNGETYTQSGTYTYNTTNSMGCDSVATLVLTIGYNTQSDTVAVACDEFVWHGVTYTETPLVAPTYTTTDGCNNTLTLHLTINHSSSAVETAEACGSYTWHGTTYTSSTSTPSYTSVNAAGCDSTTTLHLTINQATSSTETVEACGSYAWNGQTYSQSGVYSYQTTNAAGCDSTATLLLNILQSVQATVNQTACDSYTWNGQTYTQSGNYTYTVEAANGCDSVVTLTLTVNQSTTGTETAEACDSYTWHGTTYTSSTSTPSYTSLNAAGCDSVTTLHLTINHSTTGVETTTACDSYEWIDGRTYTSSTSTPTYTLSTVAGCDSVVTLHLTVNYSVDTTLYMQGEGSIVWNGETFTQSGVYERTLTAASGCDSTVTLTLSILPEGTPAPYLYNLMDVVLSINHNQEGLEDVHYIWYRWYRDGELVLEGADYDSYSEGGNHLNGCYYVEVATDETMQYWVRSNEVCINSVGIDDVKEVSFTIAPNPVSHGATVVISADGSADLQGAEVRVYDMQGRMVLKQKNTGTIVADMASGMYMVRLTLSDGRSAASRMIVR